MIRSECDNNPGITIPYPEAIYCSRANFPVNGFGCPSHQAQAAQQERAEEKRAELRAEQTEAAKLDQPDETLSEEEVLMADQEAAREQEFMELYLTDEEKAAEEAQQAAEVIGN